MWNKLPIFQNKSKCRSQLRSWISYGELGFSTFQSMMKLFETLFDDPSHIRDAKVKLHANRQHDNNFSN